MARTRQKTKGRKDSAPFLRLPKHILESEEYAQLSSIAVKLLVDLGSQFRGSNNGDLCAAWGWMKKRGWKSRDTLNRAQTELESSGWIIRTRQGGRHKANLFALTWLGIDECDGKLDVPPTTVPSNRWRNNLVTRLPCQSSTHTVLITGQRQAL